MDGRIRDVVDLGWIVKGQEQEKEGEKRRVDRTERGRGRRVRILMTCLKTMASGRGRGFNDDGGVLLYPVEDMSDMSLGEIERDRERRMTIMACTGSCKDGCTN